MNPKQFFAVSLALAFAPGISVFAGKIPNVTVSAFSGQYISGQDHRTATNVVSDTGLFGDIHTFYHSGTMWLDLTAGANTNAFITFDLGSVRTLEAMRLWNYNEGPSGTAQLIRRSMMRADILVAGEDQVFTTNQSNVLLTQGTGTFSSSFAQLIDLDGVQARYVRINSLTNYAGVVGQADAGVGLSKVQFFDTSLAPAVISATRNLSNNRVTLTFAESVATPSATTATNYTVLLAGSNAVNVLSATMDMFNNTVYLQTSAMETNVVYSLQIQNVQGLADGSVVNTQVTIEPEVALWLKADAGVTDDGSGFVTQWSDQSGNGNHAVQATAGLQPMIVPAAINGMPAVHFDGVDDYLEAVHSASLTIHRDVSVFAVVNPDDLTTFNAILGKTGGTGGNQPAPLDFYAVNNTGVIRFYRGNARGNNGANSLVAGALPMVAAQTKIISAIVSGTNSVQYLDGAFNNRARMVGGVGDSGNSLLIGSRNDLFTKMKGNIAEIILVRGAVSDVERVAITDYLGAKYGVAVINLVFNEHPTNTTRLEGQTASFFVNVSASSPDITYQWQRFGTNLPNATNASYTTPILTQADNNSTFRVQVSIPGSSQFSDTATLTVLPDTELPTVVSVGRKIWNASEVVVTFSESVSAATATTAANYTLDGGAAVTGAVMGETPNKVVLSTTGVTETGAYQLTIQNVQDLFGNAVAATQVPVNVYPSAALWLSASQGLTVDEAGFITQWNDISGNGNHAIAMFGPGFGGQVITNGFGGQMVVQFDGVNSISLFAPSSPSLTLLGDLSIYSIAQFVDRTTYNAFVTKTAGAAGNIPASFDYYLGINSGIPVLYRGDGTLFGSVAGVTAPSLGTPHIVSVVMSGTQVTHYLDGITNGTGNILAPLGDTGQNVGIGTRNDGVTKMKGDVGEFILFNTAVSPAEIAELDKHFGAKYGIQVGTLPDITIAISGGGTVQLSWPTPAQPFNLESTGNLVTGPWLPVTNSVTSAGGTDSVIIEATGDQQFFRLQR